jgi:single-strand DNA-binding protein
MAGYNRVVIVGNLTRDPEYKQLSSGQAVCRLGLATNRQFKNRQSGETTQEVCFVDIDVWGAQAESCRQYLEKGRQVLVEGRLKLDSWQDAEGNNRSKHSITAERVVFLSNGNGSAISDFADAGDSDSSYAPKKSAAARPSIEDLQKEINQMQGGATGLEDKAKKARPKKEHVSTGEVDFKDEAPFADDLPF